MSPEENQNTPPLPPGFAYGEDLSLKELAIEAIVSGLRATLTETLKENETIPPDAELRRMAETQYAKSIKNGLDDHLGTGVLPKN